VLGEHLSPLAITGPNVIASLATIVFALPEKEFRRLAKGTQLRLLWAMATGACVAIYNVIDAQGVRSGPSQWSFIVWLFLLDWIGINTIAYLTRGRRQFIDICTRCSMARSLARASVHWPRSRWRSMASPSHPSLTSRRCGKRLW
jgi:drug/metabolite transporter (DMT)-like permease